MGGAPGCVPQLFGVNAKPRFWCQTPVYCSANLRRKPAAPVTFTTPVLPVDARRSRGGKKTNKQTTDGKLEPRTNGGRGGLRFSQMNDVIDLG